MVMTTRPFMGVKGVGMYARGEVGFTLKETSFVEWLDIHTFNARTQVVLSTSLDHENLWMKSPDYRAQHKYVLKNLRIGSESSLQIKSRLSDISISIPAGTSMSVGSDGETVTSKRKDGPKGQSSWRDPGAGENSFNAECPNIFCWFERVKFSVTGTLAVDKYARGVYVSSGWTPWRQVSLGFKKL